jgi:hypothetical protein
MPPIPFEALNLFSVLAQSSPSGTSSFAEQLAGLIALVCALGAIWLGLMFFLYRRTTENHRRKKAGQPALTPIYVILYRWVMKLVGPVPSYQAGPADATEADMPAPDLGMLTGGLPEPDLSAMTGQVVPLDLPDRPATPVSVADLLAEEFSLDLPAEPPAHVDIDQSPAEDAALEEAAMPVSAPAGEPADAVEVLRVWRDLADGTLIVEIGGQRFRALNEIQDTNLQRRLMNVVRDLANMARSTPSPTLPAPPPAPARSPQPPRSAAPTPAEKKPDAPSKPADIDLSSASLSPGTMFREMTKMAMGQRPEPVEAAPPPPSIAEQIQEVLQRKLEQTPGFTGRSIHIRPSLHGGVRIEVDGRFYEGVGEVDDDAVRQLLQDAVREWEENQ